MRRHTSLLPGGPCTAWVHLRCNCQQPDCPDTGKMTRALVALLAMLLTAFLVGGLIGGR